MPLNTSRNLCTLMHFQVYDHQWIWRFYSSVYEIMCEVISQYSCSHGLILRNLIATDCVLNFWIWHNIRWSYHLIGYINEWVTPILYRGHCSTTPAWHFTVELIQMQGIKIRADLLVCSDTFFPVNHIVLNNSEAVANALAVRAVRIILSWLKGVSPKDRSAPVNAPPTAAFFCTSHNEVDSNSQIISNVPRSCCTSGGYIVHSFLFQWSNLKKNHERHRLNVFIRCFSNINVSVKDVFPGHTQNRH